MKRELMAWGVCAVLLAALPALAHEAASGRHKTAAAKKEQKAWGIAGDARAATRTIGISMGDDMRFTPSAIDVVQGETVKFVLKNGGKMLHEMVLGTQQELDEHAALMLRFPDMAHEEAHMAHVKAAGAGELVWNFNRPGQFQFACLVAGHYQAGMRGTIQVRQKGK